GGRGGGRGGGEVVDDQRGGGGAADVGVRGAAVRADLPLHGRRRRATRCGREDHGAAHRGRLVRWLGRHDRCGVDGQRRGAADGTGGDGVAEDRLVQVAALRRGRGEGQGRRGGTGDVAEGGAAVAADLPLPRRRRRAAGRGRERDRTAGGNGLVGRLGRDERGIARRVDHRKRGGVAGGTAGSVREDSLVAVAVLRRGE